MLAGYENLIASAFVILRRSSTRLLMKSIQGSDAPRVLWFADDVFQTVAMINDAADRFAACQIEPNDLLHAKPMAK
ncbi:hypothetical protein [Bradyrhizobium sp.]|uniref:hypothetical protein n=1 Tax=Bradyrhizobium sp. TaxID=376 RepID=UPI003C7295B4